MALKRIFEPITINKLEIPNRIVLNAPVVTKDNVEQYLPTAFES